MSEIRKMTGARQCDTVKLEGLYGQQTINCPIRTISCGSFTLEGFSRAPQATYWRVPEWKIGFDLGWEPQSFATCSRFFVSHAHLDHILALPLALVRASALSLPEPEIYVPVETLEDIRTLIGAYERLGKTDMPCKLVGVEPGDEIQIAKDRVVTVCRTRHSVPSCGYVVWELRKKLKAEYANVSGAELGRLRAEGVEITTPERMPKLAFLGDSSATALDENPEMFLAETLVSEMTQVVARGFLHVKPTRHMCPEDYADRRDKFQNKRIIASHISLRYTPEEIEAGIAEFLPDMLDGRLVLV